MAGKPGVNSDGQKELDKAEKQLEKFENDIKTVVDQRGKASEYPEHKISQKEVEKSTDIYLKPQKVIFSREKFNEEYREQYNEAKKYVHYTVQHEECKGDRVEMWTKCFPGVAAEFWVIPSGKPVWIPRYVADKLENGCGYHRLKTQDRPTESDSIGGQYYGTLVVDEYTHRITARPVSTRKHFSLR